MLFDEKQKYMYSVFVRTLLTDQGKAFVRQYEATHDAQKIYKDISAYALKSTKANIDASRILSYITSVRLGDGTSWRGSTHSFILHWQDQVRLYETQVKVSEHFSPGQKMHMLQNAVYPIPDLRAVKAQADQHKTQTGHALNYDEYTRLLISAASQYDAQFVPKKAPNARPARRAVYTHELDEFYDTDDYSNQDAFDIDSSLDVIEANVAARGSRMSLGQWKRLPPDAQKIWDQLDDDSKAIILGRHPIGQPPGSGPSSRPPTHKISLHDISAHQFLAANLHDLRMGSEGDVDDTPKDTEDPDDSHPHDDSAADDQRLINATKRTGKASTSKASSLSPTDIRKVLSSSSSRPNSQVKFSPGTNNPGEQIELNGKRYRQVDMHASYSVSAHKSSMRGSLVDRGANGGVAGDDVRIINKTNRFVDVRGIDNHQIVDIPIVTAGGVVNTQRGPVIAIMHQYAYTGKGKTIHSCGQLEWYKNDVNDRSIKVQGGLQRILTLDGYAIPINIKDGLPCVTIRPYTDLEWDTLPHVVLTSDVDWDPTVLDHTLDDDEQWYDAISDLQSDPTTNLFDEFGDYRNRVEVNQLSAEVIVDMAVMQRTLELHEHDVIDKEADKEITYEAANPKTLLKEKDYEALREYFGWLPTDVIKKTFEITTQYARIPMSTVLKKHYRSPFPALNVHRRNEPVATDTVYSDTPAVDDGSTSAQIFVGTESLLTDVYGMKSDKQFVNTLEDNIRDRGAPTKLISDRAQVEISNKVQDILRALCIGDWQSEPKQQHQNPAERRYQTVKTMANTIMDRTGSPASTWLLCLMYVCFILNFAAAAILGWNNPIGRATGNRGDISPLLRFRWWEPVYYKLDDNDFPSDSREKRGHFVGIAEHVGHAMTFKILTDDTRKVIYRSNVRSALDPRSRNLRMDLLHEKPPEKFIKSRHDTADPPVDANGETKGDPPNLGMPVFHPSDLIGRTFLKDPDEDGQRFRARIVRMIEDHDSDIEENPTRVKFVCSVSDDDLEEIIAYNEILDYIQKDDDDGEIVWKFRRITAHEGPLKPNHPNWKNSTWNVMIEWENGEITSEPLTVIAKDDPVTCALYAKENDLLHLDGWKRFARIAKRQGKLMRLVNQAKLRSFRESPRYKYGFEVPKNYQDAIRLDERHGNTKWQDATDLEMTQLHEYNTFKDLGKGAGKPDGYKQIRVHLVYDVKHDGRHKARLVADGHLTDVPIDSVYSGVVSLRGLRLIVFLAELNELELWSTDIGNAYLEAETNEKVVIRAGPEFGELEGHMMIIVKALYGLRTSGLRWHERFADCLRDMGFEPSKSEPDIWMRRNGDIYEYIAVYVDDLAIAAKDPSSIIEILQDVYKFKLKGTGPITFHLGCDFFRDSDGVLCMAPKKYIDKMISQYERMFGCKPKTTYMSPLEKGDHPELDTSEELDAKGIQQYQSLIGSLQWAISIGRLDITTAVMTMSGFRVAPRQGHLERAKRLYGYLSKMRDAVIRIRTEEPDYSGLPDQDFDWAYSVYGAVKEIIPHDAPEPLGRYVTLTHYVDANLFHDMITGRSVTGILHLLNKTPIDWFSKKQATVETATYGSEFVAARTCVEQVIDLRTTLRYLGVPIRKKSYMFGDNKSVVDSSITPHAKLHKRHTALSFHRVREAIAAKIIAFYHIAGETNPADILSKHWGYSSVWSLLKALMFWQGDTMDILDLVEE